MLLDIIPVCIAALFIYRKFDDSFIFCIIRGNLTQ